mmetsp:Transcript_48291/g.87231  ORF Transcript_48291/g.87231 Transcript_48291/m.87231 type:complete len:346 (-) Transcript_48291:16-1053(-)
MASFLGWRDAGQVLLSKNEGLRIESEQRDLQDHGPRQSSAMAVMSRRKHRKQNVDEAYMKDKEAAAEFPTDLVEVLARKPESRMKWLQKGLVLAGKKVVAVTTLYNIATNKKFVAGVTDSQGGRMKAMLMANLHLFSSKQQKYLQSDASNFYDFELPSAKGPRSRSRSAKPAPRSRSPKARSRSPKASRRKRREATPSSSPGRPSPSPARSRRKPRERSAEASRSSPEPSPPRSKRKLRDRTRSRSGRRSCSASGRRSCSASAPPRERADRKADKRRRRAEGSDGESKKPTAASKGDGGIVAAWLQRQRLPDPTPLPPKSKPEEPKEPDEDDPRVSMPGAADEFL